MDTWLDYSLREDGEDRRHILTWKTRQHGSGRTWRIGGNDFVGGSEQIEKWAEIEKEGETRDETWSLKDERGERLENKSWRASRDLADAASGKSHRSVTEEQEGEKKQSTGSVHCLRFVPSDLVFSSPVLFRGDKSNWPRSAPVIYDSKFFK